MIDSYSARSLSGLTVRSENSLFCCLFMPLILLFSSNALSEDISYDFLQVSFLSGTINVGASPGKIDGSGIGVLISLSVLSDIAVTLAVDSTNFDHFQGVAVSSAKVSTLGATAHSSIVPGTDVYTNFSLLKAEATFSGGVNPVLDKEIGVEISLGLRHLFMHDIEIGLEASVVEVFDVINHYYRTELRIPVRNRVFIGVGYGAGGDSSFLKLSVRLDI